MSEQRTLQYDDDVSCRLDLFLAGELEMPRSRVAKLLDAGAVIASRGKVKASRSCQKGDSFVVTLPEPEKTTIEPEQVSFDVVYEDESCAVVLKPAGIAVHPGAGRVSGTLVNGMMARWPQLEAFGNTLRPGIVHRLDLGTSGLLVVALTPEAALDLSEQFAHRETEKRYLALVHGRLQVPEGTVDAPIGRDRYNPLKRSAREDGKPALTHYRALWQRQGAALLELDIYTGRTHQIRVHCAAMGLYLDGDTLYGPKDLAGHWLQDRLFLHAAHLGFYHPSSGEAMSFDAALPPDLELLAQEKQKTLPLLD